MAYRPRCKKPNESCTKILMQGIYLLPIKKPNMRYMFHDSIMWRRIKTITWRRIKRQWANGNMMCANVHLFLMGLCYMLCKIRRYRLVEMWWNRCYNKYWRKLHLLSDIWQGSQNIYVLHHSTKGDGFIACICDLNACFCDVLVDRHTQMGIFCFVPNPIRAR